MNLDDAAQKHAEWKIKFRTAINQKQSLNAAQIRTDNQCELGKWLHSEGKTRFGSKPAFQTLLSQHAHFHQTASKVAETINAAQYDVATKMLEYGTDFTQASTNVGVAIIALKKDLG